MLRHFSALNVSIARRDGVYGGRTSAQSQGLLKKGPYEEVVKVVARLRCYRLIMWVSFPRRLMSFSTAPNNQNLSGCGRDGSAFRLQKREIMYGVGLDDLCGSHNHRLMAS